MAAALISCSASLTRMLNFFRPFSLSRPHLIFPRIPLENTALLVQEAGDHEERPAFGEVSDHAVVGMFVEISVCKMSDGLRRVAESELQSALDAFCPFASRCRCQSRDRLHSRKPFDKMPLPRRVRRDGRRKRRKLNP
ncbi:hypothetical protein F2P81_017390 [Scophthalmus maximus]|uniref:Uncharacterized protein n=1 Tax=Scophthalmus maximus TaxID=52904 RepID=A0A6A4SDM1_SCOMX|nr:hypothetical protein F2P81_017390 [Scophthalmus maximus]